MSDQNPGEVYRDFIDRWRSSLSGGGDLHVLPVQPDDDKDAEFSFVKFKCNEDGQRYSCVAQFRRHDLYLVAIRNKAKDWFYLGRHRKGAETSDDETSYNLLPVNGSRNGLTRASGYSSLDEVGTGGRMLKRAVKFLSSLSTSDDFLQRQRKKIADSCLQLVLLFAEAAESNSVRDDAVGTWERGELHQSPETNFAAKAQTMWKEKLISGWGEMSRIALNNDHLPVDELNHNLQALNLYNATVKLETVDQLNQEMGLIKQERQRDGKGKGKIGESSGTKGKGNEKEKGKLSRWFS